MSNGIYNPATNNFFPTWSAAIFSRTDQLEGLITSPVTTRPCCSLYVENCIVSSQDEKIQEIDRILYWAKNHDICLTGVALSLLLAESMAWSDSPFHDLAGRSKQWFWLKTGEVCRFSAWIRCNSLHWSKSGPRFAIILKTGMVQFMYWQKSWSGIEPGQNGYKQWSGLKRGMACLFSAWIRRNSLHWSKSGRRFGIFWKPEWLSLCTGKGHGMGLKSRNAWIPVRACVRGCVRACVCMCVWPECVSLKSWSSLVLPNLAFF